MKTIFLEIPKDKIKAITLIGFQSITFQQTTYQVCVDGELYNTQAILTKLKEADYPVPKNIEELFLFSYLFWGNQAMKEFDGAYSFIIKRETSFVIIKDPLGLKPIFYQNNKEGISLSNRINTILEHSQTPPVLDAEGILELFSFGPSISENKTLLKNIKALPMGSMLHIRNQQMNIYQYYHLKAKKHYDSLEVTIQKVHDILEDTIIRQSKNAHASFLSGGLDSSIITSVCARHLKNWHTYSLEYEGNRENFVSNTYQVSLDDCFIDDMCSYTNVKHTKLCMKQEELVNLLDDALLARATPGMADVDASLLWLTQQVKQQEDIILSGECSDEIFGGYPWFYRSELKDIKSFPWLQATSSRIALLNKSIRDFPYEQRIQEQYDKTLESVDYLESDTSEDRRVRAQSVLCLHWFMQTLVTRQVCMGNAANINIRAPFANVKLLEYVYNIPWSMKFLGNEEKGILRKAFENELPKRVVHRKKNPFPKTHHPLYAQLISDKLRTRFDDLNSPLHILFDDIKLEELICSKGDSFKDPWYGQLMSGPQLLAYIYQIEQWILHYHIQIHI
ncbi:MAG: asparagine synthase-related protein [Longicatena sp.]